MRIKGFFTNLQIKVLLLFLFLALVPLGIVATFSIRTAEELIINMASNQLGNVADDKVSLLERWITEREADLKVVAGSSILRSMGTNQIEPYLRIVWENYKVYKGFIVFSHDGHVVYDSYGKGHPHIWEKCSTLPLGGTLHISDIFLDPEEQNSFFHIFAPISDYNGEVIGVICATVDTRAILSIILRVSLGETGECYLVDRNGTFLAHKEPRRILNQNIAQSESFKNIFGEGQKRRTYTDYRGIEVLGTSRKVSGTEWYLVVEQDRDEAFLSADRLKHYVYLVILFFIGLAIALSLLFSYYIVNPIRSLSEATKMLARGEFEKVEVKTDRRDEIGALYRAFKDMADQLYERHRSLKKKVDLTQAELEETDVRLKKTQLAAARSEQLAALGRLAAGVTHEIRTPLSSIKLFLESARSEIEISPEYEEDFQIAMNQIKRIESTINRFLDFAKPQEPVFSVIDIAQLTEDALLVVRLKANQLEITVDEVINQGLPPVKGDKKQLEDVLLNLMVNALESMEGGGRLVVRVCLDICEIEGIATRCIRIDISDTGPGIPGEYLPRLFEPFFTTKASGTGLGLSIVYSTIQMHGGDIKVENCTGRGCTFSLFLPAFEKRGKRGNGKDTDS